MLQVSHRPDVFSYHVDIQTVAQGLRKYQFGCVNSSVTPDYPCKLTKDCLSCWVQIEDAINQGYKA